MPPAVVSKKLDVVFSRLEEGIRSGRWKIGDQMPTENELATELGCSRGTISKALARLEHAGRIERRPRAGTRVIDNKAPPPPQPSIGLDAWGFICPGDQHEGIWRIGRGFQQAAFAAKDRSLMLSTGENFRKEAEIVGRLHEFKVKGAVLYPVVQTPQDQIYYSQMILASKLPLVLVDLNLPGTNRPAVVTDAIHAGKTITQHLLAQNCRKLGFLANYAWTPGVRDRYLGYLQALEEAGIPEDRRRVFFSPEMHANFDDPLGEPTEIARRYLARKPDIDAVVCSNDFFAIALVRVAPEFGLRVPRDFRVVGIDDYSIAAECEVPVTTYRVDYEKLGRLSFELLKKTAEGQTDDYPEIQVRGKLVVRTSG
jgi:Transcriptional regulators